MSILPPHLDPFATGDFDERCYRCERANLDNPATPADTACPIERYGRTPCAACCVQLWVDGDEVGAYCADCHDAMNIPPTRNPVSAATPTQITTSASSEPVAALTNTIAHHVEPCDHCHRAYSTEVLTPVINAERISELLCEPCVDRLREELRDLGLAG